MLLVCLTPSSGCGAPQYWPIDLSADTGFNDLGQAIKKEPGFPRHESDIEKARYVFSRMAEVASRYGLESGTGGFMSNTMIGLGRFRFDPENADCLKTNVAWGNCGEWSYAFSEILSGAGVSANTVAYGDKAGGSGRSLGFGGTDTMVIVEERAPDGRTSRRVFDPFRAAFHSGTHQPTPETLAEWGDIPLTDYDKWRDETVVSWQSRDVIGKPYIKRSYDEAELQLIPDPKRDPRAYDRPKPDPMLPSTTGLFASMQEAETADYSWKSTWTRVGDSDVYKAAYTDPQGKAFGSTVNIVKVSGSSFIAKRIESPDRNLCTYHGTIQADRRTVTGTYSCTMGGKRPWRGTIEW
jgi:hypothetical protein